MSRAHAIICGGPYRHTLQSTAHITAKDNAWLYSLSHQTNGTGESEWIHFTGSGYLFTYRCVVYPVLRLSAWACQKRSVVWLSHLPDVMGVSLIHLDASA
ncbi:DUF5983 family protein [Escherichia coli]|uniref:DUF5983 family protein n=1 Tax=Escherichia coli TaxID=562 RepID=UPI00388E15EC